MTLRPVLATLTVLFLLSAPVRAQDAPPEPPRPDPGAVRLLDEVPNYATILGEQWQEGVGKRGKAAESDWDSYGRLVETGEPRALTLSDCILLALRHNTGLQVERLTPLSARAGVRSARSMFDPALFSEVGKTRAVLPSDSLFSLGAAIDQDFNANLGVRKLLLTGGQAEIKWSNRRYRSSLSVQAINPDYISSLTFSVSQPLLRDFGLRYATILVRVAQTAELQAIRAYEAKVAEMVKRVEEAYWGLVLAMQQVKVQEQALAAGKELERQNRGKFEVGTLPRTAVLEAETMVAQRQAELIRVQNAEKIARDNLRALLNVRVPEGEALIQIEPSESPSVEPVETDVEAALERARERRPELQAAQLDVHAKALSLKAAQNQLLPRLDAVAAVGTHGLSGEAVPFDPNSPLAAMVPPGNLPSPFAGGYGDALNLLTDGRFYSYSAGVVLTIPFSNAQSRAGYAAAQLALERARLSFQALQQQVTLEVKSAITNLESDRKSIEATRIARELAEENLRNQQARYDVGLATTKDLLDFQDLQTRARAAEVQALIRYSIDLAELRRVEGTLLSARNVVLDVLPEEPTPWWARF